ncbi:MAG TPA: hypothetical protein VND64_13095 [Pirellulales bacterium]|nr:hypothetical protein [Pirellulales bacterium]
MNKITPDLPKKSGCTVTGFLYDSDDPCDLGQDMVEVETPTGVLIEAGWYPEGDAAGSYRIAATRGLSYVLPPTYTRDVREAAGMIEKLACAFSTGQAAVASGSEPAESSTD